MTQPAQHTIASDPLNVKVVDGLLTVSIGIDFLAFLAVDDSSKNDPTGDFRPQYEVANSLKFAHDVAAELTVEDEDGGTMLTQVLTEAMTAAVEGGSEAVRLAEDSKAVAQRLRAWDGEKEMRKLKNQRRAIAKTKGRA